MPIRNFCTINDKLACAGQPGDEALAALAAAGYEVIVNLGLLNTVYALPGEAALVNDLGMEYYHIPVVFGNPQLSELGDFIAYMDKCRHQKILVHCAANYRASVFVGLYLLAKSEIDEAELTDFVNDLWQPNKVWENFLANGARMAKG